MSGYSCFIVPGFFVFLFFVMFTVLSLDNNNRNCQFSADFRHFIEWPID